MKRPLCYKERWAEMVPVCVTVWCTHAPGASVGEEADRTADEPNPQVSWSLLFLEIFAPVHVSVLTCDASLCFPVLSQYLCHVSAVWMCQHCDCRWAPAFSGKRSDQRRTNCSLSSNILLYSVLLTDQTSELFVHRCSADFVVLWDAQPQC